MPAAKVTPQAGLIAIHYPCLASIHPQRIGDQVETVMHVSGCIVNEALEKELHTQEETKWILHSLKSTR
jgi:hypothetical protein